MIANLNKDTTLKAQKARATTFLNKNWKLIGTIFDKVIFYNFRIQNVHISGRFGSNNYQKHWNDWISLENHHLFERAAGQTKSQTCGCQVHWSSHARVSIIFQLNFRSKTCSGPKIRRTVITRTTSMTSGRRTCSPLYVIYFFFKNDITEHVYLLALISNILRYIVFLDPGRGEENGNHEDRGRIWEGESWFRGREEELSARQRIQQVLAHVMHVWLLFLIPR